MNLIEAIKSGRRFRRKSWTLPKNWLTSEKENHVNDYRLDLPIDAIIADDWEVESEPVTITREQFDAAWDNALLMIGIKRHRDALAKELGL